LLKKINKTSIDPSKLVGKYIPNVTAKPFALTKEYFEDVYKLTNSPKIGAVLANWDKYNQDDGATNGVEGSESSSGEYEGSGRAA
jgi:fatty acid synthase subunit beta